MKNIFVLLLLIPTHLVAQLVDSVIKRDPILLTIHVLTPTGLYSSMLLRSQDKISDFDEGKTLFAYAFLDTSYTHRESRGWVVLNGDEIGYIYDGPTIDYDQKESEFFKNVGLIGSGPRRDTIIKWGKQFDEKYKKEQLKADVLKIKAGIYINNFNWNYQEEYSSSVDIGFKITNYSKNAIKYIHFFVSAKDAVGGVLKSFGKKATIDLKGIGPIEYGYAGTYSFDHAFYSNVINRMRLDKVSIEYMNGGKKVITNFTGILNEDQ